MLRRSTQPAGFTLVEVLVASTAMALLMTGVLTVVSAIARDQARMGARPTSRSPSAIGGADLTGDPALGRAIELLRRDLACAQEWHVDDHGILVITGHSSFQPPSGAPQTGWAKIEYEVRHGRDAGLLVRRQTLLDASRVASAAWTEAVLWGVAKLAVEARPSEARSAARGRMVLDQAVVTIWADARHPLSARSGESASGGTDRGSRQGIGAPMVRRTVTLR